MRNQKMSKFDEHLNDTKPFREFHGFVVDLKNAHDEEVQYLTKLINDLQGELNVSRVANESLKRKISPTKDWIS